MADQILRIHPAIGMARVGNSRDYYLAPESMAGEPQSGTDLTGGLPIRPDSEDTPITSAELRDSNGALKRQAARFRIYHYPSDTPQRYPTGVEVEEVRIGSKLGGKAVTDILWTVHLANKKAACWILDEELGERAFQDGKTPALRNPDYGNADAPERLRRLVIDAGPRAIAATGTGGAPAQADFDAGSEASYWSGDSRRTVADYPKQFPADAFKPDQLYTPVNGPGDMPQDGDGSGGAYMPPATNSPIDYLGTSMTDAHGRLVVVGGHGRATGFSETTSGAPQERFKLPGFVNNDGWFDDTSDGPVTATLVFDDGSQMAVPHSAWVVVTDPSYAPQIRNAVTLWDDAHDSWVRLMGLAPELYDPSAKGAYSGFRSDYKPVFDTDIKPIFIAAGLQQWAVNLNQTGLEGHIHSTKITADDDAQSWFDLDSFIRDARPDSLAPVDNGTAKGSTNETAPLMPLSLGDAGYALLTLSQTQYFFMQRWSAKAFSKSGGTPLNAGEFLDKATLVNCLGGRFNPGIDMTFIIRDPALYDPNWKDPSVGPFRIHDARLDYAKVQPGQPFLGVGYTPLRAQTLVEPGDLCKFMAVPWHTDYNSCATHTPSPNPGGPLTDENGDPVPGLYDGRNLTTFWSWPAQRPVATYTFDDLAKADTAQGKQAGQLPKRQHFCVRGTGTTVPSQPTKEKPFPAEWVGRYQNNFNILVGWNKIGFILQAPAIEGYDPAWTQAVDYYLETANIAEGDSDAVDPYPVPITQNVRRQTQ